MELCSAFTIARRGLFVGTRCVCFMRPIAWCSCVYYSSISKSGDKGPRKIFKKKVQKSVKKTKDVNIAGLITSLKTFEQRGKLQADEQNKQEDIKLKLVCT